MKGLRFERIGQGRYYNVVFHLGGTYVPVSDETIEELKTQSLLPAERFLDLLIDRVGYSSYLKDQIRKELKSSGDPVTQITVLQGAIRELWIVDHRSSLVVRDAYPLINSREGLAGDVLARFPSKGGLDRSRRARVEQEPHRCSLQARSFIFQTFGVASCELTGLSLRPCF